MRKATDQRDAQIISLLWTSFLLFHGGDVTCYDACHVIWCGGQVIWCDVIACVVSCHVMQCDVMWCALMWCALQWSRCVFRSGSVTMWWSKYYSVLQSATLYYKVLLQYYSVLQRTTPVLLCTTTYYSSTTLYYKVLLQYYCVLQSTTTVLLRTTTYCSSTTPHYPLLQSTTPVRKLCTTKYYSSTTLYYTVLQHTTPVLLCTTTYYSSTTLYYKVLLQYYCVLQSTTTVLLRTTTYCSSTTPRYPLLQSTTPVLLCTTKYYSSTTLYYKVLLQYYSVLQRATPVLFCTIRRPSEDNPRIIRRYIVISHPPPRRPSSSHLGDAFCMESIQHFTLQLSIKISRNAAPATSVTFTKHCACHAKWISWLIRVSHMKRHLQCAEQQESQSNFTKYCACHAKWISWLIRMTDETSFTMRGATGIIPNFTKYCACHAKWISWLARIRYETSFTMRGATRVTLQLHQILRLPRNSEFKISAENPWIASVNIKTIRRPSEDNPRIIRRYIVISHPPPRRPSSSHLGDAFCMESVQFHAPAIYQNFTKCCACHECHLHQILRLPRKMNLMIDPRLKWNVTYNARRNRNHNPTWPNTAPATQNESHDWSAWQMKRHLQCAEQQESSSNFTKYCACRAKWISWLIRIRYETSFTMRGATRVTLQLHQILRLPRNSEFKISAENPWIASVNIKTIRRPSEHNPTINRHLAPAASETFLVPPWRRILYGKIQHFALRLSIKISPSAAPATKSDTPTSPNAAPAT